MSVDRRDFLKLGITLAAGTMVGPAGFALSNVSSRADKTNSNDLLTNKWGMVIDVDKCAPNCNACVNACRKENNIPDFSNPELDIHWIRKVKFKQKHVPEPTERSLPAMCFHCEDPPCAHVCPVEATFVRKDGIVLVDKHRCIGCRYCMVACPYKARSFVSKHVNPENANNPDVPVRMHGVVEKCNFCVHRIDVGKDPACVEACHTNGGGGMQFGKFNQNDNGILKVVRGGRAQQLRADLGTNPKVYYVGI